MNSCTWMQTSWPEDALIESSANPFHFAKEMESKFDCHQCNQLVSLIKSKKKTNLILYLDPSARGNDGMSKYQYVFLQALQKTCLEYELEFRTHVNEVVFSASESEWSHKWSKSPAHILIFWSLPKCSKKMIKSICSQSDNSWLAANLKNNFWKA